MQKLGFLKFQEATGSLSGPIYTPINAGRNKTELMLKKKKNQCGLFHPTQKC